MKFKDPGTSSKDLPMTESPSWEELLTVSELVDSLMAWQLLAHIIQTNHYGPSQSKGSYNNMISHIF